MGRTMWTPWLIPLVVLGSLAGCGITSPEDEWGKLERELAGNRLLWEQSDIEDYTFTTHPLCECIPFFEGRALVTVEDGEIVSVERTSGGSEIDPERWGAWETIGEAFEKLAYYVEHKVAFLEVAYDPQYGYPLWYEVDISEQIVDDERRVDYSDFSVSGG